MKAIREALDDKSPSKEITKLEREEDHDKSPAEDVAEDVESSSTCQNKV